jgi:hypothetical protein
MTRPAARMITDNLTPGELLQSFAFTYKKSVLIRRIRVIRVQ